MNKYRVVSRTFLYLLSCFVGVIAMVYARSVDGGPILSWVTLLAAAMGIIIGALVARLAIWMLRLPPRARACAAVELDDTDARHPG